MYHPIIGLIILAVASLQVVAGIVQHMMFNAGQQTKPLGVIHVRVGRILITLGIINGGSGLLLNGEATRAQTISYGVVAALIWVVYLTVSITYIFRVDARAPHSTPMPCLRSKASKILGVPAGCFGKGNRVSSVPQHPNRARSSQNRTWIS